MVRLAKLLLNSERIKSYLWLSVKTMSVIDAAVSWAIGIANDNSHGYSQADRWGPDYDCSSMVISAFEQAGVPVRSKGAGNTATMRAAFIACGFVDVTTQVGLASGYGLQPGDVLLNYTNHTCLYVGNGKVANARTNEGNAQAGDQSGNEIRIQSYWNFPWNCVLRYKGSTTGQVQKPSNSGQSQQNSGSQSTMDQEDHGLSLPLLKNSNSYSTYCVLLQALLNARHFACGSADGFYGAKTMAAVSKAQKYFGLKVDGECGPATWAKLFER